MFKRAVSLLCVVVLLFTMNTLKRTANTLERVPMCGFEEHVHDSGCYNSAGELACGMPEHVHTDACYQESPTGKGTLDDLDLRVDGLDGMGDVVDGDGAGNLDLSMDLDQGGLLDFVQSPGNQTATTGSDLQWDEPVVDAAAGSAADNADDGEQGMVVEIEDEPVEAVTETKEEQPAETEAVTETKEEEQPAETESEAETETEEEQPAETEGEAETEEEQPTETEAEIETKEEEQPAETEGEAETETEEEQPAETEGETETETEEEQPAETESEAETETEEEQPAETEGEAETETEEEQPTETEAEIETKEEEQSAETEGEAETETEEEQPAETEGEVQTETETETKEEEQPAETEGETETGTEEEQPAETETETETETEEEQPAESEGETETETEEEQPAETEGETETETEEEQPAETEGETETETEEEQPAETEGETETEAGDEASDDAEAAAERRYTATVDLTDNGNQPISLREAIANATPAEEYEDAVDEAAELPVDEWSVEFDSGLFEAVATEDDVLLIPLAGFESAEVIISNGSRYELTLLNCVVEPSEGEAQVEDETEAGDEAEAPVAYPAVHFEQGTDHVNVVVDAPEGAFPEGTTMTVEDVRDEGTIQSITDSVTGDFVEVTSVNAVNISFWHDGVEIEPLLPIAVVMSAVEADAHADTPVVVHVADDGETTVVDSESIGANGASLEMPAAQTFEADTFSIYAIVGTQTLDTKYIDEAGNTWSIRVSYTEQAGLPEGATLKVTEVKDESYLAGAQEALESGKRITKARFFDITILDRDGNEVQPKAPVDVIINLVGDEGTVESDEEPTEVGDPSVRAIHFVEEGDGNVKVESQKATETEAGVTFAADSFSVWGVVYTVDFEVEGNQGVVTLDFTDFDATTVPGEGAIFYNTEDCNVHIALSLLEKIIRGEAETEFDIGVDADVVNDFRFDFEKAAADKVNREVALDNGEIVIGSDGFVELTDGERTLRVEVENLSALKQALLETEGVSIEVIEGNVPVGSEASYTAHTSEETAELVETYINNEENGDVEVAGYCAADLKIVRNDETLPVEGRFQVTVDKASLVPEGMKLDKLYHIHEGEVEPLKVDETEDGLGLVFEVSNFSDIVASYTVEFHNDGKEVVIPGGSQVLLSTLIDGLGLTREDGTAFTVDEVVKVEFATPSLFDVEEVTGTAEVNGVEVDLDNAHDFLITSLKPFDEDRMYLTLADGTVIVVRVTDDNENDTPVTHTTTIEFYDVNSKINGTGDAAFISGDVAVPNDPVLQDNYYVLMWFTRDVFNDKTQQNENKTFWTIKPVELKNLNATSASVQFGPDDKFKRVDEEPSGEYQLTQAEEIYNVVKTRLYRSSTALTEDQFTYNGETLSVKDGSATVTQTSETGYEFGGHQYDYNNYTDKVQIRMTNDDHAYRVRLRFDSGSTAPITPTADGVSGQEAKHYYLLVKVYHRSGTVSFGWKCVDNVNPTALPVDDDGYYYFDSGDITNWTNYNNETLDEKFTGQEPRVEALLVRSIKAQNDFRVAELLQSGDYSTVIANAGEIYYEGVDFQSYKVHYDTRDSRGSNKYYTDKEGNTIICYDQIDLISKEVGSEYDYTTILGPNIVYGIVAEHLYQPNHLQTNFAVNHFSGHGHDVRPDLSGSMPGNIVIGEFNISDGSKRNSVGDIADDPTWGRLKVGKPLNGTLMVYADNDSGYFETDESGNKVLASVYDNPAQTIVVPTDGKSLSENIVEPGIEYGKRMSAILASKPSTFRPALGSNKVEIDTTAYDEYATIYLDGDLLKDYIGTTGGLTINKKDHQTIVFNFTDKVNSKEITISQFTVKQPSFANYGYPDGYKTESPEATGSDQNKVMDDIARHIVWNCAACTKKVTIDTAGGIFLQPNDDSETEIKGTTAGWIVSDGYVYNGTAEWHNVFEEMPDSVEVNLFALKYLDGKMPPQNKKYTFQLDKLAFDYDNTDGTVSNQHWAPMETVENNFFTASFTPIRQDQMHLGWNIFRITETGKATGTEGTYITDNTEYYAAVYMDEIVVPEQRVNNIYYTVTMPRYYTACSKDEFKPYLTSDRKPNPELTAVSGPRSAIPVFENETVSTGLTLMKKVNGTTVANKPFVFGIELWKEDASGNKSALSEGDKALLKLSSGSWTTEPTTKTDHTYAEVTLKNGRRVTIDGITQNTKYRITEIKIGDKLITDQANIDALGYIDGYKPVTGADKTGEDQYAITGTVEDTQAAYSETFVNEYKANGHIDLDVSKVMNKETREGEAVDLIAGQFAFTLTSGSTSVTGYNLDTDSATGKAKVEFPTGQGNVRLSFTQDDMTDAKKDEDGHLVKEITYVIHESRGNLTDELLEAYNEGRNPEFSYDNVVYDDDRQITLILTDMGDGTIEVTPKTATDSTVSFTNVEKKKAEKTLEAFKTMEGRDMKKAEFIFNAKLISVNGTDVTEAAMNATGITDEQLASLVALRKQASPVDVIGSNEKADDPTVEDGTTYTTTVNFPTIHYSEPGAYVYEITEDTGSMPTDAKPKDGSVTKYLATVTVSHDMIATVAYSKVETDGTNETVTALATGEYPTFVNETKTIGFEVTKLWKDKDGADATGEKFITFSLTRDNIHRMTGTELAGKVTKKAGTEGNVEIDGDTVKLTSDASGSWPTAVFSGLPAGRYQVKEESHTAVSGSVMTSYTQPAPTEDDPDAVRISSIVRDGGTQIINNKETKDTYTNITVNKVWKAGDTEYVPTSGNLTFELWEMKTAGASSTSGGITYKDQNGNTTTGSKSNTITVSYTVDCNNYDSLIQFYSNLNSYYINGYYACESFDISGNMSDNKEEYKAVIRPSKPAAITGDQAAIRAAVPDNGNYKVNLEFEIPVPQDLSFEVSAIRATLNNLSGTYPVSILTKSEDKVRTFVLSSANGWSWNSGSLPLSKNDGAITWKYYIKEANVPENFNVTFSPAGSETGKSGLISTNGSATVTATNTQTETVERKVKKIWTVTPPEGTEIQLGLYAGVSEMAALATSPMRTITLDGTVDSEAVGNNREAPEGWQATFTKLPKYGTDGNALVYIVKELNVPEGYRVKYDADGVATYGVFDGTGEATVTNEPLGNGSLTVTKKEAVTGGTLPNATRIYKLAVKDSKGKYYNQDGTEAANHETAWVDFTLPSETETDYTKTWSNLPTGTYTVEEQGVELDGFVWTVTGLGEVKVEPNADTAREVVNTFDLLTTDIPVTKTWEDGAPGTWSVTFALKSSERLYSVDGVVRHYNSALIGWTDWTRVNDGTSGEQVTKTITNATPVEERVFAGMPKYRVGTGADAGKVYEIRYTADETACTTGNGKTYTLAEMTIATRNADGTFSAIDATNAPDNDKTKVKVEKVWEGSGSHPDDVTLRVVRYKAGVPMQKLTISHKGAGINGDNLPEGFAATYTITGGKTAFENPVAAGAYDVEPGTYTVTVSVSNPAAPAEKVYNGTTPASAEVTITKDAGGTAEFVSSYGDKKYGNLVIRQGVSGLDSLPAGFSATYTISNGSTVVQDNATADTEYRLEAGISYTVTANVSGETVENYNVTTNSPQVIVNADSIAYADVVTTYTWAGGYLTFTHVADPASLTLPSGITYTVTGGDTTISNPVPGTEYKVLPGTYTVTASGVGTISGYTRNETQNDESKTVSVGVGEQKSVALVSHYTSEKTYQLRIVEGTTNSSPVISGYNGINVLDNTRVVVTIKTWCEQKPAAKKWALGTNNDWYNGNSTDIEIGDGVPVTDDADKKEFWGSWHYPKIYTFEVVVDSDTVIAIQTNDNTGVNPVISVDHSPKLSALAISPFQLAFNPFTAYADEDHSTISEMAAAGYGPDADYNASAPTVTVDSTNNWSGLIDNLDVYDEYGQPYYYGIEEVEVPEGFTVRYSDPWNAESMRDSDVTVTLTATNTPDEPDTGALKITKQVTVNNNPTNTQLADGTYNFTITGPENFNETRSIKVTGGVANSIELSDLRLGDYTITETGATDGHATLSERSGGTNVSTNAIQLTVTKDSTASNTIAVFTNNVDTGVETVPDSVTVHKQDDKGSPLPGATFKLYSTNNSGALSGEVATYGGSGVSSFIISTVDLALANYLPTTNGGTRTLYLKETEAPTGYLPSDTVYNVVISTSITGPQWNEEQGKYITTTTYTMTIDNGESKDVPNTPKTGSVTFTQKKIFKYGAQETKFGYSVTEYTDNTYGTVKAVITDNGEMSASEDGATTVSYTLADVGHHYYIVKENLPEGVTPTDADRTNGYIIVGGVKYDLMEYEYDVEVSIGTDALVVKKVLDNEQTAVSSIESTFTNEQLGELKITKNITVNGTIDPSRTGTFWYAVYKSEDVENNAPKKNDEGKIIVSPAKDAEGKSLVGSITVNQNGAETVTVPNLNYGDYYVFELTGDPANGDIDVKLIDSGDKGVDATIGGTVYHVTESGTTKATVGATPGTATLNNDVRETSITGEKTWKPFTSDLGERKNPVNTKLTLTLTRYTVGEDENGNKVYSGGTTVGTVEISTDANGTITKKVDNTTTTVTTLPATNNENYINDYNAAWSYTWENLPLYGISNGTTVKYAYKVDETVDNDWYSRSSSENSGYLPDANGNTTQQFTNIEKSPVALPSTGGAGTGVVYGAGAALVLLALLGFIMMNRKRSEGDGI